VLQAAAVTAVAATAAACSTPAVPAAGPSGPPSGSAPSVPSAPAGLAASSTAGGGSTLGPTSAVPDGGGVVYPTERVVVTQPAPDVYRGYSAVCPHEGCLVNRVSDERIYCPCHGSVFSIFDGSRLSGPAPSGLATVDVTVVGDDLVLRPG
jgi:nitrite reductase/ring-hydroxylating ferredoxin subunit